MLEEEAICRVRLKAAHALLCKAILVLAECCPSWFDDLWHSQVACAVLADGRGPRRTMTSTPASPARQLRDDAFPSSVNEPAVTTAQHCAPRRCPRLPRRG